MKVIAKDAGSTRIDLSTNRTTYVRYDNLILFSGILGMVAVAIRVYVSARWPLRVYEIHEPSQKDDNDLDTNTKFTAEQVLIGQVADAAAVAKALYDRSLLLISGGIVMAFIGVGVFYVALPELRQEASTTSYLPTVIRSVGILLFVEAIAWFLLRQYRVQIEDYKSFYRIYLRRANLLLALKTISAAQNDPAQITLAAAFLQDDQAGRVKAGETTEAAAALQIADSNPIFDLFRSLLDTIAGQRRA